MSSYFDDDLYYNTIINNDESNNENNNISENINTDMNTLEICGYLNKKSFYHNENIELHVHQPNPYNLNKKINMIVYDKEYNELFHINDIPGQVQSWSNNSFAEGCNWTSIYQFQMPQNYKSDIYLIKLYDVMESEEASTWPSNWDEVKTYKIAFILKDANKSADICILANTNTWEAYNDWAGFDGRIGLYKWDNLHEENNINDYKIYESNNYKSSIVNFNRPNYWINQEIHEISVPHERENIYGELHTYHTSHLLIGEIYLLKWLDSINYSYNIISDCDLDDDMNILSGYKMLMLNCHSEYWTLNMYKNVLNYSSVGGNIMSLSGNTMYWYSEISNNKLEVRKNNSSHTLITNGIGGLWKNILTDITSLPLPHLLLGSEYHTESFSYGEGWPYKIIDAKKNLDTNTSWIFDNVAGLIVGQDSFNTHPDNTLVGASGWEVDRCVIGEEFIIAKADSTDPVYTNDIIYFINNYNSKIFNTGSIRYTGALQKEVQIDTITKNVIDRFLEDTDDKVIILRTNEWFSNNIIFTGSNLKYILDNLENKSYNEMQNIINNTLSEKYNNLSSYDQDQINIIINYKLNDENMAGNGIIPAGYYKLGIKIEEGSNPTTWYKVVNNTLVKTTDDENCLFYLTDYSYSTIRFNSENGNFLTFYEMENGNFSLKIISYYDLLYTNHTKYSLISLNNTDYETLSDLDNVKLTDIFRTKLNAWNYNHEGTWLNSWHIETLNNYEYPILFSENPSVNCEMTLINISHVYLKIILNEFDGKTYEEMNILINNSLNEYYNILNNNDKNYVDLFINLKLNDENLINENDFINGNYKLGVKTNNGEEPNQWYKVNENNELEITDIDDETSTFYLVGFINNFTIRYNSSLGKYLSFFQKDNGDYSLKLLSYYELANNNISKFGFSPKEGTDFPSWTTTNFPTNFRVQIKHFLYDYNLNWVSAWFIDSSFSYPKLLSENENNNCELTLINLNNQNGTLFDLESILDQFENKSYNEMTELINNTLNNSYLNLNNEDKSKVDLILSEKQNDENLSQTGNIQSGFYKLGVKTNAGETPIEWYKVNNENQLVKTSTHDENSKFYLTGNSYKFTIRHNSENGKIVSLYQMDNSDTSLKLKSYNELSDLGKFSFITKTGTNYEAGDNLNYENILRIKINQHLYSVDNQWLSGCHIDTDSDEYPLLKFNSPNENCQITLIPYDYVNNEDNSNLLNLESILNELENKSYNEMNDLINNSLNNSYINLNNEDKSTVDLILSEKQSDENLSQTGNIQSGFYKLGVKTDAGETPIEWYQVNNENYLIKTSIHDENSKFYLSGNSYKFTIRHNSENGKIVSLYQMDNGNTSLKLKSYNELIDLSKFSFITKTGTDYEDGNNLNYENILRIKINQHLYSVNNQWVSGCHIDTGSNEYPLLKYNNTNDNCQITLIPYDYVSRNNGNLQLILDQFENKLYNEMSELINNTLNNSYLNLNNEDKSKVDLILSEKQNDETLSQTGNIQSGFYKLGVKIDAGETPIEWYQVNNENHLVKTSIHDENSKFYISGNSYKFTIRHNSENGKIVSLYQMDNGNTSLKLKSYNELTNLSKFSFINKSGTDYEDGNTLNYNNILRIKINQHLYSVDNEWVSGCHIDTGSNEYPLLNYSNTNDNCQITLIPYINN